MIKETLPDWSRKKTAKDISKWTTTQTYCKDFQDDFPVSLRLTVVLSKPACNHGNSVMTTGFG